jgi:CheY-like chemotaxis protein
MVVLLVEDDDFKAADVKKVILEFVLNHQIENAASVTSALRALSRGKYELVILDMSLPTFDLSGPGGGGSPEGQGGIEVLRLAKRLSHDSACVIVTQYPDIEIDGKEVSLETASKLLSEKFGMKVVNCILYEFDSDHWRSQLRLSLAEFFKQGGLDESSHNRR